ncbi:MAG: hypothetical protein RI842_05195 [Schleiferiaceae bacterium]|nr:hypothetical protein [Schleiferiaceae bacterium]MDR9442093.1 hypothetical protein [Schleiferiaceae bacterium]
MINWKFYKSRSRERSYHRSVLQSYARESFTKELKQKFTQPVSQVSAVSLSPLGLPWEAFHPRRKLPLLGRPLQSIKRGTESWALYKLRYASLRLKVIVHFWQDKALIISPVWSSNQLGFEEPIQEALQEKYDLRLSSPPYPLIADTNGAFLTIDHIWQQMELHYLRPKGLFFLQVLANRNKQLNEQRQTSLLEHKASLKRMV